MSVKNEGLIARYLNPLDERVNTKLLMRVWGPRVEFLVRLILVATFLDDSFRTVTDFSDHVRQVGEQGCLKGVAAASPELASAIASLALAVGLLAKALGSLCLLALIQPDIAIKALIGWAVAQPILYAQVTNLEFVAESLSLVGGLLMLNAHMITEEAKREGRHHAARTVISRTQLLGRLLLPTGYLYHAGCLLLTIFTPETTETYGMFVKSLSLMAVNAVVLVGMVLGCTLVAAGLKSRSIALTLALVNFAFVFYQYPFFRFVWYEGGEWKYDEIGMQKSMPHVALPTDISPTDFEPWQMYDLHRYYFFQGLSTSGALLLLAQFGPGEMSIEDEGPLLPVVQRAQD